MHMAYNYVGAKRVGYSGEYGNGNTNTPIHLSNLQCVGNESEIYHCMGDEQPTGCTHDNDASLECLRKYVLTTMYITWLLLYVLITKYQHNCK